MATTDMAVTRMGRGRDRDRGQTAIEFLGVTPLIILLFVALWQCALIGYTFSLAGHAADEAARAGAVAEGSPSSACEQAARDDLPGAWHVRATTCRSERGLYKAKVTLDVPVLVPGVFNLEIPVDGDAAAAKEG